MFGIVIVICGIGDILYRTPNKVLGFLDFRLISKIIGIVSIEHSWVGGNTIKLGKISAL